MIRNFGSLKFEDYKKNHEKKKRLMLKNLNNQTLKCIDTRLSYKIRIINE